MAKEFITISGNIGQDPSTFQYTGKDEDGNPVKKSATKFSVACDDAPSRDSGTTWWNVTVFSDRLQEPVQQQLYKGAKVAVQGFADERNVEGKTYHDIVATRVGLVQWVGGSRTTATKSEPKAPAAQVAADDTDF